MVSDSVERMLYDMAIRCYGNDYDSALLSLAAVMAPPLQDRGSIVSFCSSLRDKFLEFCRVKPGIAELLQMFSMEINDEIYSTSPQLPDLATLAVAISGKWPWRDGYKMSVFEIACVMLLTKSCCRMVVVGTESCFSLSTRLGRYCTARMGNPNSAAILARLDQMHSSKEYAIGLVSLSDPLLSQIPASRSPECFIPLTIIGKMPINPTSQTALAKNAFDKILAELQMTFD